MPRKLTSIRARPYDNRDRGAVFTLLRFLPSLYPGGLIWLERRLDDAAAGRASCSVAMVGDLLGGVIIETPKGKRTRKISNLYVASHLEHVGMGSLLMSKHILSWQNSGIDCAYITIAGSRLNRLQNFLNRWGFAPEAIARDRYGIGRDEHIYRYNVQ